MTDIAFPFAFDGRGQTATADADAHIHDLILQVLLTAPGERVMRPDFGAGLPALVFEPNGAALAATTQFLAQGSLQQHLSHLIDVGEVEVESVDARLEVTVHYVVRDDGRARTVNFALP